MSDRLFDVEEYPEIPLLPEPRGRKGAAAGSLRDERFRNSYPPSWDRCQTCVGSGQATGFRESTVVVEKGCPDCLGMGSLKAMVRLLAGHRCERCLHPYMPKGDAVMVGAESSWRDGGWSVCDERCTHDGPVRALLEGEWEEFEGRYNVPGVLSAGVVIEAAWRILTVHHLDGDKANVQPYNLTALCQRCHLYIQHKVVMERIWPGEHTPWFRWHAAGYYADVYLGYKDLSRVQIEGRLNEFLSLESTVPA